MQSKFLINLVLLITLLISLSAPPRATAAAVLQPGSGPTLTNPILFVTQLPIVQGFGGIATTFGNHLGGIEPMGRGGDLWIRYGDGTLKNLTLTAGYGIATGLQSGAQAIAVRDPAVHWSGTKAIFSMIQGAPTKQYDYDWQDTVWQLYEITGLGQNETPVITKVANQPTVYNNVSPVYGSDDRIIFTTDRPRGGEAHLYPPRDEYELAEIVSGVWSLDPATGDLRLLNHAPSGDFTPIVDSYGRVIFTQWDHLQRDQEADADDDDSLGDNQCNDGGSTYGTFNYADESASAAYTLGVRSEIFPEPRPCRLDLLAGTHEIGHRFNHFFPWMVNQDGTESETLNHLGRHELHSYFEPSLDNDANLTYFNSGIPRFNPNSILSMFQIKEDPNLGGRYYGVDAQEFGTHAAGEIIRLDAPPTTDADHISVTRITRQAEVSDPAHPGLFREPLPLAGGQLVAVHTADSGEEGGSGFTNSSYEFRLKTLKQMGDGHWIADQPLTSGIVKSISYWSPDAMVTYSGILWELNPVEVRQRPAPPLTGHPALAAPEQQMFAQAGIDVAVLQAYMVQHNLALLITRNVTSRDDADTQQPFNLQVPGGVQSTGNGGTLYNVTHLQIFQGDQIRGWTGGYSDTPRPGRRVLAQYLHDPVAVAANPVLPGAPTSSVAIAADGSVAAFVPARRAMTWQLTDAAGNSVVRERYWVTFQPGEVRMCTSCHGLSQQDQAKRVAPTNAPQALLALLDHWEAQNGEQPAITPTAVIATNTPPSGATATATPPTNNATATSTPIPPSGTGTPTPVATPVIVPTVAQEINAHIYLPVITGQ